MSARSNFVYRLRKSVLLRRLAAVPLGLGGFSAKEYFKGEADQPISNAFIPLAARFHDIQKNSPLVTIIVDGLEESDHERSKSDERALTSQIFQGVRSGWLKCCTFRFVPEKLTTSKYAELVSTCSTPYVLAISKSHEFRPAFLPALIKTLQQRQKNEAKQQVPAIVEPRLFDSKIPPYFRLLRRDGNYSWHRPSSIYGIAFSTKHMHQLMDAFPRIDISTVYLNFRIFFTNTEVNHLPAAYSIRSQKTISLGITLDGDPQCLFVFPRQPENNLDADLRTMLARYIVLLFRGALNSRSIGVSLDSLRNTAQTHSLSDYTKFSNVNDRLEVIFLQWLESPFNDSAPKFKELSQHYVTYGFRDKNVDARLPIASIQFSDTSLSLVREYHAKSAPGPHYRRPISPESTILIFDRSTGADDNGEAYYRFLRERHPEFKNIYFALGRNSTDWTRLLRDGFRLVPMFSTEFYQLFMESDCVVSSQLYNLNFRGKNLSNSRFIYLQHGIQMNDMSNWIFRKFFDVFVVTGADEAAYMNQIAPLEVLNSGLPRLEKLQQIVQKTSSRVATNIVLLPTWRAAIHAATDAEFIESSFFQNLNNFLKNEKLARYLKSSGRTLQVKLHPNLESRMGLFHQSTDIEFVTDSYRDLFSNAAFAITDYSSAVLDAAFVNIPIAYLQWDQQEFYRSQLYKPRLSYFDEGLGPVFNSNEEMVRYIVEEQFEKPRIEYIQRRQEFFRGVTPDEINETIFERMIQL